MIRPYDGKEGYLFISYSHKDMDRVMPIVSRIHELGYNVWYDEGIDPGTEWADTIALHIEECSIFIGNSSGLDENENMFGTDKMKRRK